MSPESGSTAAIFPIGDETVKYLALIGHDEEILERIEVYAKAQGV